MTKVIIYSLCIWCFNLGTGVAQGGLKRQTIQIHMRDGVDLATDIYKPDLVDGKIPVILIRTNLNKNSIGYLSYYFMKSGYALAVQDVRGRFASGGIWDPYFYEAEDGYDTIEWLARQDWCNGKIGMLGGSYSAIVQFLAAKLHPPHLVTIIPHNLPADPFKNAPFENGIFLLAPEMWWINLTESDLKDYNNPDALRASHKVKDDPALYSLPVSSIDSMITGRRISYFRNWLSHNKNDEYWQARSYENALSGLNLPVLLLSGWYDTHSIGAQTAWDILSGLSDRKVKLIIGPWNHANAVPRYPSTRNTGPEANMDVIALFVNWFDYWLKGMDNGIMKEPAAKLYIMNGAKWLDTDDYPDKETKYTPLYFHCSNGANSSRGDGKLLLNMPDTGKDHDEYSYDPGDPTPAFIYRNHRGRATADSITSLRNDMLVFTSPVLDTALTVLGSPQAVLYASTDCIDTDWFVYLYAMNEKNEYMPVTHGCIRARYRNSLEKPEFPVENQIYEYRISLWPTGLKLEKGWKIRVEISSADFPQYSRNLNNGNNNETGTSYKIARQRIYHSVKYPSAVIIPVIPNN